MPVSLSRTITSAVAALVLVLPMNAAHAVTDVSKVTAHYRIQLAGIEFGTFKFSSKLDGDSYVTRSEAKLKALFGAFKWRGSASVVGKTTARGPMPERYAYSYRRNKRKARAITVGYANRRVTGVTLRPKRNLKKGRVPVTDAHKVNVMDPMSALAQLSMPVGGGHPCKQKVQIFDGRHRFDVAFTPKGRQDIETQRRRGFGKRAFACAVRYTPIAGHKTGKDTSYIAKGKRITVLMVPARNADFYVPFRITVPTVVGNAVLQAQDVNVVLRDQRRLALSY
ncbi:MAG: DUF3108 domain-containing protein [Pseudomonadota bacterium]